MSRTTKNSKAGKGDSSVEGKPRGRSLAQRARSFKEDFLGILSHMRSPGSSGGPSESSSSSAIKDKTSVPPDFLAEENLPKSLEYNVRQARFALSHFRSVIRKNHLEMLPGNGTVVLETVTAIQTLLNKHVLNDVSSSLVLASNRVQESVAKLLKFCDDYLLIGEEALSRGNIMDVIAEVGSNIDSWVVLIKEELGIQDEGDSERGEFSGPRGPHRRRTLSDRRSLAFRHGSFTYIPHSSFERDTPENTTVVVIEKHPDNSESSPGDSPPPKPPLPDRINLSTRIPPPLPPKKRQLAAKSAQACISQRSKSPEGAASVLTESAGSLDSVLNQLRVEDDEIRVPAEPTDDGNQIDEGMPSLPRQEDRRPTIYWDNSGIVSAEKMETPSSAGLSDVVDSPALAPDNPLAKLMDRLSGSQAESGFGSIPSRRSSSQSCSASSQQLSSARSSQQSYSSQESYQTEKRVLSPDASCSSKVPSVSSETDPTILSTSSSFEKLSFHKRTYTQKTAEHSGGEFGSRGTSKQSIIMEVSHGETKIEESRFVSSPSSPTSRGPPKSPSDVSPSCAGAQMSPDDDEPPALPEKTRTKNGRRKRNSYHYDPERVTVQTTEDTSESTFIFSHIQTEEGDSIVIEKQEISTKKTVARQDTSVAGATQSDTGDDSATDSQMSRESKDRGFQTEGENVSLTASSLSLDLAPPPLPPKKRPIMAYMEMFGNASHSNSDDFLRHSVYAYKMLQNEWLEQQRLSSSAKSCCFNLPTDSNPSTPVRKIVPRPVKPSIPPALPPKKSRSGPSSCVAAIMPALCDDDSTEWKATSSVKDVSAHAAAKFTREHATAQQSSFLETPAGAEALENRAGTFPEKNISLIDSLDVLPNIQLKKVARGVYVVKGGPVDALIAHAANSHENDFMYEEAFIITYRTFITPLELFQKLVQRFDKLCSSQYEGEQKASKETFDFIVRAADSLTLLDLDQDLLRTLMDLVHKMVRKGDLSMGASLRNIIIHRCELKKLYNGIKSVVTPRCPPSSRPSLLDFKSEQIAEQMTMMDAELFLRIESPEILTWAEDQREELSPNLSRFTVHFNKMSYWTRSRILEQRDSRSRERYLLKFVKIMKHLRKINNFNSCLALLSALDSAPVRRLDWQKQATDGIQEHSDLIDSSSSFRAYRQALADSQPPCIPYIGLVLQDLTFINAGNPNLLPDGSINFSKRWQQYDVIQNMARFKIGLYNYRKNEKIIKFFNDFDEALSEEEMWQLSEKLKPRPSKKS